MKNKLTKIINNLSFVIITISLVFTFVGAIAITYFSMKLLTYSYYLIGIGLISIIIYIISKIVRFRFSKLEIAMFGLIILTLLSLIGTIDYKIALWGISTRCEGLFAILSYYAIALLTTNIKNKKQIKILIGVILTIGFFNIIYGIFQTGWINQSLIDIKAKWHYARGFYGNSMCYGALLSICYPIVFGIFLNKNNKINNILYGVLLAIYTFGIVNSGSMAIFLANFIILAVLLIVNIVKYIKLKCDKYAFNIIKVVISIILFILCIVIIGSKDNVLFKDLNIMKSEANHIITTAKVEENFGTGRIFIWNNTIKKIKEHFGFGVGIDNFNNAFPETLKDVKADGKAYNVYKAHNEYLQIMLCEGFFTGVYYVVFLISIAVKNFTKKDKIYYIILLGFIGYCIQAFFGISVIRVSPVFFVIVGILMGSEKKEEV